MSAAPSRLAASDLDAALVHALPVGVAVWRLEDDADDESLRLAAINPMASRILGLDLERFLGEPMAAVFHASTIERRRRYAEAVRTGVGWRDARVVWSWPGFVDGYGLAAESSALCRSS